MHQVEIKSGKWKLKWSMLKETYMLSEKSVKYFLKTKLATFCRYI